MKTQTKGIWITLLAAACFGAASPIAKGVYQYDITVSCVLTWRFFMASILLWAYLLLFRRDLNFRLKKDQLITLAVVGGAAHFLTTQCYFNALKYVPISIQIMFFYTYPFMVNGLSVLLFGEKMNRGQLVSLAAAFIGILMTVSLDDMRLNGIGILFSIGAAVCQTAYILLLGRRNVAEGDSLVIVCIRVPVLPHFFSGKGRTEGRPCPALLGGDCRDGSVHYGGGRGCPCAGNQADWRRKGGDYQCV